MAKEQTTGQTTGAPARRLADIPTRWSILKGAPRLALDYLYRVYGTAILNYIEARLRAGHFSPLRADDAEDVLQEFFLRLGRKNWLGKPDPARGRFRPFFVNRLHYFLRERRAAAIRKQGRRADEMPELEAPDLLAERLEKEWKLATVHETLARLRKRNPAWHDVLRTDLDRSDETDAELAVRTGQTLEGFRSRLKRARAAFREVYPVVEAQCDGFGGESV
jgi:DNA-directed RNA polymerase specialized sigma24 family protein